GVLGVAGGTYQPKVPSAYWSSGPEYIRMQVLHTVAQGELILDLINPDSQMIAEVAVADGVWLCSRREVWLKYQFDEQTFPGFHFYDIDYCTAIASQYRICITFEVLLEHFSKGSVNEQWLLAALDYQKKWAAQLPFGPATLSQPTVAAIEKRALTEYVNRLLKSTVSTALIWQQLWRLAKYGLSRETIGLVRRLIRRRYLYHQAGA
ncbi:MAG TPA: glycosyltransferase, partial [Hymenobacter sp.]